MAESKKSGKALQAERRRERLAAELRSNLIKRKEQARKRVDTEQSAEPARKREGEA